MTETVTTAAPLIFTFICADCGREHNSPTAETPQGWDLHSMDCSGARFLRCPDCAEKVEQAHFDRMADFMATHPGSAATAIGVDAGSPEGDKSSVMARLADTWRATTPPPSPFSVFLEKQDGGDYRVALLPEAVLMRWLPLGFFLTPAEARATARDLMHYAAQAERPGALVEKKGAVA